MDQNIKFKYTFRPYQDRVLKNLYTYLQNKKVHIVAAPGSGKTILGLEIFLRLRQPVIIFAPTVTIKNQWVDRFISSFTDFKTVPDWISTDIYNLKYFNVVTYQALHCAYKKCSIRKDKDVDTDDIIEGEVNTVTLDEIKKYDLVSELKNKNIKTIILDEAHHLKSEWWNSLNKVVSELSDSTVISLTATPPYDSDQNEWNRYISLCGEIDAEISVPELVKANNLCPHQDYIYFNEPTLEEKKLIDEYDNNVKEFIIRLKNNTEFLEAIKNHPYILSPYQHQEQLLDNVEYYSSMLIYLNDRGVKLDKDNLSILGNKTKLPVLDNNWLEILLKNVIISDRKSYINYENIISEIEKELNKEGIIEQGSLSFSDNKKLENYFLNSIGKLNSISEILKLEKESLKDKLRMVVLTDYIRKEYLEDNNMEIKKLGVIPIFKKLLNDHPDVDIAVLTGTMFIVPKHLEDNLFGLSYNAGIDTDKLKFKPLTINEKYSMVEIPSSIRNKVMSLISKLFSIGEVKVIVGTKSLLGEGWDEPSINTLVLASFVGSFMLSNQMRGRAIRVNSDPNKTANIWHLVCVANKCENSIVDNSDFNTLKRRFTSFVGLDYDKDRIESGITRLGSINGPFTAERIKELNDKMKWRSSDRISLINAWKVSLDNTNVSRDMTSKLEFLESNEPIKMNWFISKKIILWIIIFLIILFVWIFKLMKVPFIIKLFEIILGIYIGTKIYSNGKQEDKIKKIGYVVLESLVRCKFITTPRSKIKLKVDKENNKISCYITGVTLKESTLFSNSLEEVFSKTVNQRYIISRESKNLKNLNDYYNVPTVLSTNKEYAIVFSKYWRQKVGDNNLIYTRNADGRKLLLKARMNNLTLGEKLIKKQEYYK